MGMLSLTLLLYVGLIFNLATAFLTNNDIGDCSDATPNDGLPDIVEPLNYNIRFNIRIYYKNIMGESSIRLRISKPTHVVALHAQGLQISDDAVILTKSNKTWTENGENSNNNNKDDNGENNNDDAVLETYKPQSYRYCSVSQILEIHFEEEMPRGYYVLHIPFITTLSEFRGFIQYAYFRNETITRWLLTTFMEINEARKVFPCWDDISIKAFFNISVQHSSRYIIFSNSPERYLEKEDGQDVHVTRFHPTAAISPSLLMVTMISNVINCPTEYSVNHVWHREEAADLLIYTRRIIENVKQYLSLATDVQEKKRIMNFIMIPNNPMKRIGCCGLYLLREQDYTYDENTDFPGRKIDIPRLLAYSISRRWFLGVVSPRVRTDLWLGEALATFFSHYTVAKMLENALYIHLFVAQNLYTMLHYDTEFKMQSVQEEMKYITDPNTNEIDKIIRSPFIYTKGAFLIRMLQYFIGTTHFRDGIDTYVREYKSSSASVNDFWDIMQEMLEKSDRGSYNIKEMMDKWLTRKQFPIIRFDYNLSISTAKISVSCENGDDGIIPISYTMLSNFLPKNTVHLRKTRCSHHKLIKNFPLEEMIIINPGHFGYYRVNYDNKNWRKISSHLRYENHTNIHVLNRASFIDDAFYFVMKSELDTSVFLDIIQYYKRETEFVAWYPIFNIMSSMSDFLKYTETFLTPNLLDILDALLKHVGYEETSQDNDMKKALRLLGVRWACKLAHVQCQKTANVKLNAHITNPVENPVLSWWKDWVYCTGIQKANLSIWYKVLDKSIENKDLKGFMYLTCSDETPLLLYYLDWLLSDNGAKGILDDYERYNVYREIIKKHVRKETVLEYILKNYENILSSFGASLKTILGDVIMSLQMLEDFDKITKFAKRSSDDDVQSMVQKVMKVRQNQLEKLINKYIYF